jgi:hypothetical protein
MHDFTVSKILPIIVIDKDADSPEVKAFKSIKRLIIFEVVHEKAWPITQPSLCRNISLRYDEFPVENIHLHNYKIDAFHYLFSDPTTIGNVIAKLRHGFYDKSTNPKGYIVQKEFRTSENIARCARELMEALGCQKIPPLEYFISLATDKHALQEFKDLPSIDIPDNPESSLPYPEGNINNIYSDLDLVTKFTPTANPEDEASPFALSCLVGFLSSIYFLFIKDSCCCCFIFSFSSSIYCNNKLTYMSLSHGNIFSSSVREYLWCCIKEKLVL